LIPVQLGVTAADVARPATLFSLSSFSRSSQAFMTNDAQIPRSSMIANRHHAVV
jgi:hypothetical protein